MQELHQDDYFSNATPPAQLQEIASQVQKFIEINANRSIVLVTSGGTTVPLESQTVRFLDNFSAGTRGAASAEYFIQKGYACIFLHRQWSLEPYTRHYTHSTNCFLDLLEIKKDSIMVSQDHTPKLMTVLQAYQHANHNSLLLKINFTTISEYLFLLKRISQLLNPIGPRALFYLAAAVSDFFIPQSRLVEHKIQSTSGLSLSLDQVPKMIKPLVSEWAPNAFITSFKLETDPSLLISKSKAALDKYGHQVVIGNMLTTRKHLVWFITETDETEVRLSDEDIQQGTEIELYIIQKLVHMHDKYILSH